jgi:hypothetical protein
VATPQRARSDRYSDAEKVRILRDALTAVSSGTPLEEYCRQNVATVPAPRTIREWARETPDGDAAYARAREDGADAIATDCLRLVDAPYETGDDGRRDPAEVQARKLAIDTRLRLLKAWFPTRYGDQPMRVAVGGDPDGVPIQLDATSRSARIQALVTAAAARRLQVEVGKPRQLDHDAAGDDDTAE